jgi:Zn-dependent M32 family carboxypeptidase
VDIEKAKKVLKELKENKYGELLNCYDQGEEAERAIETVLNELDKKDKIIDILLNEAAKEGTPSEFEYRKKRILEICKEKVEGK